MATGEVRQGSGWFRLQVITSNGGNISLGILQSWATIFLQEERQMTKF